MSSDSLHQDWLWQRIPAAPFDARVTRAVRLGFADADATPALELAGLLRSEEINICHQAECVGGCGCDELDGLEALVGADFWSTSNLNSNAAPFFNTALFLLVVFGAVGGVEGVDSADRLAPAIQGLAQYRGDRLRGRAQGGGLG